MAHGQSKPVMLDPSFLFSRSGFEWIEDPHMRGNFVVPRSVGLWLRGEIDWSGEDLVAPDDRDQFSDRRDWMAERLEGIPSFSTGDAKLPRVAQLILDDLILDDRAGLLRAEEWAFLLSHSVLLSKLRHPVEAFRDAGATVIEVGRKVGLKLLEEVIPASALTRSLALS